MPFQNDRLATLDGKALNHVLANSDVYQKPEVARFNLGRIVGQGVLVQEGDIHRQQVSFFVAFHYNVVDTLLI